MPIKYTIKNINSICKGNNTPSNNTKDIKLFFHEQMYKIYKLDETSLTNLLNIYVIPTYSNNKIKLNIYYSNFKQTNLVFYYLSPFTSYIDVTNVQLSDNSSTLQH